MTDQTDLAALRAEFLRLLTTDSETKDRRRREFNQAIFNAEKGWAIWSSTDLDMVMSKFDRAARAHAATPQPDAPIGWWSVSGDDLEKFTPEAAEAMQDALRRASVGRKTIVTIDGITLRWHAPQPAPDALRAAAHPHDGRDHPECLCPCCINARTVAAIVASAAPYLAALATGDEP